MPSCLSFPNASLSMKFFSGGVVGTGLPCGITARKTPTVPENRTMMATSPGTSSTVIRPVELLIAMFAWFASNEASRVTSRVDWSL